jgi:hypothetical protein
MNASVETRFWKYVAPIPDDRGCWEWSGSLMVVGYGQLNVDKRPVGAHRLSWEIHNGTIPNGLHILHRCDNKSCVNPAHLFLGTHLDNMADAHAKGILTGAPRKSRYEMCPRGHLPNFTTAKTGERRCKTCNVEYAARVRRTKKK